MSLNFNCFIVNKQILKTMKSFMDILKIPEEFFFLFLYIAGY